MEEIKDIDITIVINPGSDDIGLAENSQILVTISAYTQNVLLASTAAEAPRQSRQFYCSVKNGNLTSHPACRETLRAEKYEGYFDFDQLKTHAHSDCHSNST